MHPVETYLSSLHSSLGAGTPETSGYPALSNLLDAIGDTLKPKITAVIHPANNGAGIPDGGLFFQKDLKNTATKPKPSSANSSPSEASSCVTFQVMKEARPTFLTNYIFPMAKQSMISDDWAVIQNRLQNIHNELFEKKSVRIPVVLQQMLVSAEDHRFFQHVGFDAKAIVRAMIRTSAGHPQGGSTIAQQLFRTLTGRFERTLHRKITEIRMAVKITQVYSRSLIPAYYLFSAYYGWRMNGLDQAYKRMRVSVDELTDEQAAGIIARLKYPEPRCPSQHRQNQISRRTHHILRLYRQQWSGSSNKILEEITGNEAILPIK